MGIDESLAADRRSESRQLARGPVILKPRGGSADFSGWLLDINDAGFRARHRLGNLAPGERVEFEIAGLPGAARVCWTRAKAGQIESGFSILPEDEA